MDNTGRPLAVPHNHHSQFFHNREKGIAKSIKAARVFPALAGEKHDRIICTAFAVDRNPFETLFSALEEFSSYLLR
ncbi:MAG: hypothetical protein BWX92_01909 [Deltaproteobacteria bacterium ADurb.Bin135]|nr:MAG: hypothetical protein BWX92_01909 [Deltaproteobacteria bacterium ADurb.Bin135]